ncbi:unnamed protein product [Victoria cruziana]
MSSPGKYPSFTARTTGVSNPIRSPSFHLSVSVSAQQMLSPLVFFPISTHFTAPLKIPSAPTALQLDALHPIILDNACILCLTAAAGTELADAYSSDTVIASSLGKEEYGPCLSPNVANHPLGPATDHRLAVSSCCPPPKGRFLRVITHPPLETPLPIRLACVKHAASVHPEPGSNSP